MNEELDLTNEGQASVRQETAARPAQAEMPGISGTDILIDFWASDKRSDTVLLHLDPATVRPWSGNPREYGHLDCLNVADLIHSIRQDGQKMPVVVRRVHGDPRHRYEIIAGTRRHWAVSWLRQDDIPDLLLLARSEELSDRDAFRLADLENRTRTDISDVERGRSYAIALKKHFGDHQGRMASQLNMSQGHLSKLLRLAEIPDDVVKAFSSITDITVGAAYELAVTLKDDGAARLIQDEAAVVACDQQEIRSRGRTPISPSDVALRLLAAGRAREPARERFEPVRVLDEGGQTMLTWTSMGRSDLTLKLNKSVIASCDDWAAAFGEMLRQLENRGQIAIAKFGEPHLSSMKD